MLGRKCTEQVRITRGREQCSALHSGLAGWGGAFFHRITAELAKHENIIAKSATDTGYEDFSLHGDESTCLSQKTGLPMSTVQRDGKTA